MSILIQNGTLLLPEGPARADLRLEGDKIAQIGPGLPVEDSRWWTPPAGWFSPALSTPTLISR